jgi:hypothetical protein
MCTITTLSIITPNTQMELSTSETIPGMQKREKRE